LAPNRVKQFAKLYINTARAAKFSLLITDMGGKVWRRMSFDVSGGSFEKTLNLSELPAGVYQLTATMNQLQTAPLRFVKE
ncbi:MAG: T9SS type A sorting domain-containing protein, partial [Chitinophagaceae bacterium]